MYRTLDHRPDRRGRPADAADAVRSLAGLPPDERLACLDPRPADTHPEVPFWWVTTPACITVEGHCGVVPRTRRFRSLVRGTSAGPGVGNALGLSTKDSMRA